MAQYLHPDESAPAHVLAARGTDRTGDRGEDQRDRVHKRQLQGHGENDIRAHYHSALPETQNEKRKQERMVG